MTPDESAFRERLASWRSLSPEAQRDWYDRRTPQEQRVVREKVLACPDRGGILPISMQPENCRKCGEKSECRAGKGAIPGRVTLRDCFACQGGLS